MGELLRFSVMVSVAPSVTVSVTVSAFTVAEAL